MRPQRVDLRRLGQTYGLVMILLAVAITFHILSDGLFISERNVPLLLRQAAVTAIRSTGDRRVAFVEGYPWSAAADWSAHHPRPWIADPLGKVRYEAHEYWDADRSGRYALSYAEERAGAERRSRSESDAPSNRSS